MKKIIIFISIVLISNIALAESPKENLINTRAELAMQLNLVVRELKVEFKSIFDILKEDKTDVEEMQKQAENFAYFSEKPEINPTLLDQAKKAMVSCNYDYQDLIWQDNKWKCIAVSYKQDCEPNNYEERKEEDGNGICKIKDNYKFVNAGWGICDLKAGKQYKRYICMLHDDKNMPLYEVDEKNCESSKPDLEEFNLCVFNPVYKCPENYVREGDICKFENCTNGYHNDGDPDYCTSNTCWLRDKDYSFMWCSWKNMQYKSVKECNQHGLYQGVYRVYDGNTHRYDICQRFEEPITIICPEGFVYNTDYNKCISVSMNLSNN